MKLDLHNVRHDEVKSTLEGVINHCLDTDIELTIVTGNSEEMKRIVISLLNDYNLDYRIGDFLGLNKGYITAYIE